ncbi:MAG: nucleotide exchange factor GrpE [alpha proteobacterium MED-G10]|nr:MAG: nucleotide exchange factor GrpE [alpha proteobacterium MED-G10]
MQKDPINKNKSSKQKSNQDLKENKTEEQKKDSVDKNQEIVNDLKHKLKECEDKLLRSLAENDNLRKRHEKETEDNLKYATKNFAFSLLPVTDNFQRAIQSIPDDVSEKDKLLKNLVIGIQAVEKELDDVFVKNGIKKFDSLDQKFNPEIHQAVSKVNNDKPEGTIVEEFQRGYMIGDRLLRAAMVVVSMGPEKKEEKK